MTFHAKAYTNKIMGYIL